MIGKQLKEWATERKIAKQESDRNGFCSNIVEEMHEYALAVLADDIHEKIDAWCDIIVFSEVESIKLGIDPDKNIYPFNKDFDVFFGVTLVLGEWLEAETTLQKSQALGNLVDIAKNVITTMGYDTDKCLQETFKEINSRTGEWNPEAQKWQKYTTPEAKKKWYKADYSRCKIG